MYLLGHFPLYCNVLGYFALDLDKNVFDQFSFRNQTFASEFKYYLYIVLTLKHFILCDSQSIGGCSTEYIRSNMRSNREVLPTSHSLINI